MRKGTVLTILCMGAGMWIVGLAAIWATAGPWIVVLNMSNNPLKHVTVSDGDPMVPFNIPANESRTVSPVIKRKSSLAISFEDISGKKHLSEVGIYLYSPYMGSTVEAKIDSDSKVSYRFYRRWPFCSFFPT